MHKAYHYLNKLRQRLSDWNKTNINYTNYIT